MSDKLNKQRNEYFKDTVVPELKKEGIHIKVLNGGSYRLLKGMRTLDYYPASGKYHNIVTNVRGILTEGTSEELIVIFNQ